MKLSVSHCHLPVYNCKQALAPGQCFRSLTCCTAAVGTASPCLVLQAVRIQSTDVDDAIEAQAANLNASRAPAADVKWDEGKWKAGIGAPIGLACYIVLLGAAGFGCG